MKTRVLPNTLVSARKATSQLPAASKMSNRHHEQPAQQLAWLLILLLLFIYLAGSCLFWAKVKGLWPFGY